MEKITDVEDLINDKDLHNSIPEFTNEYIKKKLQNFSEKRYIKYFAEAFTKFYNLKKPYDKKKLVYSIINYSLLPSSRVEVSNLIPVVAKEYKKKNRELYSNVYDQIEQLKINEPIIVPKQESDDENFKMVDKFYKLEKKRR